MTSLSSKQIIYDNSLLPNDICGIIEKYSKCFKMVFKIDIGRVEIETNKEIKESENCLKCGRRIYMCSVCGISNNLTRKGKYLFCSRSNSICTVLKALVTEHDCFSFYCIC